MPMEIQSLVWDRHKNVAGLYCSEKIITYPQIWIWEQYTHIWY